MKVLHSIPVEWIQLQCELCEELMQKCEKSKLLKGKILNWLGTLTITDNDDISSAGLISCAIFTDGYIAFLGESDMGVGVQAINDWHLEDDNKIVCFSKKEYDFLEKRENKNIEIILDI